MVSIIFLSENSHQTQVQNENRTMQNGHIQIFIPRRRAGLLARFGIDLCVAAIWISHAVIISISPIKPAVRFTIASLSSRDGAWMSSSHASSATVLFIELGVPLKTYIYLLYNQTTHTHTSHGPWQNGLPLNYNDTSQAMLHPYWRNHCIPRSIPMG